MTNDEDPDFIAKWDDYWYEGAIWASKKSKDPKCRVGAMIVDDGVMISSGFNGLARNTFDDPGVLHVAEEKLKLICHAEANAIFNAARHGVRVKGATIYVTKFPCLACCNAILQVGIERIYTHDDRYWDDDPADKADPGDPTLGTPVREAHSRKRSLIQQSKITVTAPFHPDYSTARRVVKKPTALAVAPTLPPPSRARPRLVDVPEVQGRKRGKRSTAIKSKQENLFPARQAIAGGRAGSRSGE